MVTSFKKECSAFLDTLLGALLPLQRHAPAHREHGALWDPACRVFHTRAAEAVFPLSVMHKLYRDSNDARANRLLDAAVRLGDWLISKQQSDGSWLETPETWQATTTDQLLALSCALPILEHDLSPLQRSRWRSAIVRAADFLTGYIQESVVHVNYLATTAASLAAAHRLSGVPAHRTRAGILAERVLTRYVNSDAIIEGEGHRRGQELYGIDIGYNLDMTLWSLALYARFTEDHVMAESAARSLAAHLIFIYPDGSIDNSWGVRSSKWTVYGSLTAHGAAASFALLAQYDPRFPVAALRTLRFLKLMHKQGLVGYGPHHFLQHDTACIYPTFARASSLALCIEYGPEQVAEGTPLPCDLPSAHWVPSAQVAVLRTEGVMATVCGYRYKAPGNFTRSKYMARPSGGGITALWFVDGGLLQAASQGRYRRWEPIHFPAHRAVPPLGPRIEARRLWQTWSSLYEYDVKLELSCTNPPTTIATGSLRDSHGRPGPLRYTWTHAFFPHGVRKEICLFGGGCGMRSKIVEPIITGPHTQVIQHNPYEVYIQTPEAHYRMRVLSEGAMLTCGETSDRYSWPLPALQGTPIYIHLDSLLARGSCRVTYELELMPVSTRNPVRSPLRRSADGFR